MRDVATRRCMLFANLRELIGVEVVRKPHQRRPEAAMNEGDLPFDQAADQNVRGLGLPASSDGLPGDQLGQAGHGSLCRCEHHPALTDETLSLLKRHVREEPDVIEDTRARSRRHRNCYGPPDGPSYTEEIGVESWATI